MRKYGLTLVRTRQILIKYWKLKRMTIATREDKSESLGFRLYKAEKNNNNWKARKLKAMLIN